MELNCINLSMPQEVTMSRMKDQPKTDDEEHREKVIISDHDALLFHHAYVTYVLPDGDNRYGARASHE